MKKLFLAVIAAALFVPTAARADVLVNVDLSVANQVTIVATSGLSAITTTGSDGIGIYFESFYSAAGGGLSDTSVSGNFTSAENTSDLSPDLFRGGAGADTGLNLWSWTDDATATFTAGAVAFSGAVTFGLDADDYADMVAGSASGDIFFPADTSDDVAGLTALGTYVVITAVPEPTSIALLGMAGVVVFSRRRRS